MLTQRGADPMAFSCLRELVTTLLKLGVLHRSLADPDSYAFLRTADAGSVWCHVRLMSITNDHSYDYWIAPAMSARSGSLYALDMDFRHRLVLAPSHIKADEIRL